MGFNSDKIGVPIGVRETKGLSLDLTLSQVEPGTVRWLFPKVHVP